MNYISENVDYKKKQNSKQKLKTADYKKVKLYTRLSDAIYGGEWKLAKRCIGKINSPKVVKVKTKSGNFKRSYKTRPTRTKYNSLPGVNASEQTRFIGQLEYIIDNEIKTDIDFHIDEEGIAKYNL